MADIQVIAFPTQGMQADANPLSVPVGAYRFASNVRLEKQTLAQRHGIREIPLLSATDGLVEEFEQLNWQGGISYIPSAGQSAIQFASKREYLLAAAGGRKFTLEIEGGGERTVATLVEVTGALAQPADVHQIWLCQAENFAIAGDDFAATWIWDSANPAFASPGYNTTDRPASRVPNRMRLPAYTNGRLAIVTGDRGTLIGDIIHGSNLTNASDLLKFVEQTYWAEGQQFILPTNVGPIVAVYSLPSLSDNNGQGDFIMEGAFGVYALNTNVYPRTEWATTFMLKPISLEGGAQGQFAFDTYNDDAIRRTLRGIETLSFSSNRGDIIVAPQELLSEPVDDFLATDYGPLLRFASVKVHRKVKRVYATVRPWLSGFHWQHRGILSFNYQRKIWESLWTFPPSCRDIKQLLPMRFAGDERMFAICAGEDKCIRLVEIDTLLRQDVLEDGTRRSIVSQVETRAVYGDLRKEITPRRGQIHFENILGKVVYSVQWKANGFNGCWRPWQEGSVCQDEHGSPGSEPIDLQEFPGVDVNGIQVVKFREIRFLIKWEGRAELRFFNLEISQGEASSGNEVVLDRECLSDPICCTTTLFDYSYD